MSPSTWPDPPTNWSWPFLCVGCGRSYPQDGFPFCCPDCGDIFDLASPLHYRPTSISGESRRGLDRFRDTFPLPPGAALISLGEGATPMPGIKLGGRTVYFKCEYLNPTGSFKDRGTTVLVSALKAAGVLEAVEDSSGNAGASFAAYAARAAIRATVFVPAYASGPKRAQIEAYGAKVIPIPGPRSAAANAVRKVAEKGTVYASHAHLPHGLAGIATAAFEIVEQLGREPGAVIMPVGQGTLLLGVFRGFEAMIEAGAIERLPQMVGVQARACAPLWAEFDASAPGQDRDREGETIAEGIRIREPLRARAILAAVERSDGRMVAVDEDTILHGRDALSRRGLYVEPTSAVVWPALLATMELLQDPVVAVLTGSGLKNPSV